MVPLIVVDQARLQPLYRKVEAQLREAIVSGRLAPGTRLPGVRTLARELGVARITVSVAYEELAADGLLERSVGSGSRVTCILPEPFGFGGPASAPGPPFEGPAPGLDLRTRRIGADLVRFDVWEACQRDALRELVRTDLARLETIAGDHGDPLLRRQVAVFLAAARGISCRPDQIVIAPSAQSALASIAEAIGGESPWLVEDPGDPILWPGLDGRGLLGVPVDGEGVVSDALPASGAGLLVSATWQYPLGGTLSPARRDAILAWGAQTGAAIVETDFEGHLVLEGPHVRPLRAESAGDGVIYVGTFSTLLFPGVRTAFIVLPDWLVGRFDERSARRVNGAAAVEQRTLAIFLRDGHLGRHILRVRRAYRGRQDRVQTLLRDLFGDRAVIRPSRVGGHALVEARPPLTSAELVAMAAARGVTVEPLADYSLSGSVPEAVVASHASPIEGARRLPERRRSMDDADWHPPEPAPMVARIA